MNQCACFTDCSHCLFCGCRYGEILDDMLANPESHGGPPDCIVSMLMLSVQLSDWVCFLEMGPVLRLDIICMSVYFACSIVPVPKYLEDWWQRRDLSSGGLFSFSMGGWKPTTLSGQTEFFNVYLCALSNFLVSAIRLVIIVSRLLKLCVRCVSR